MAKKKTKKKKAMGPPPCGSEEEWEAWGEQFGKNMEKWAKHMEAKFAAHEKAKRGQDIVGLLIGLFVLAWGVVWMGNEMGWWQYNFPFWPIIVILVAIAILSSVLKKAL